MSFLLENNSQNLAARITDKGRKQIAQGNFNIAYFQVGDSEFDYGFSELDGISAKSQKVLMPFDRDSQVKYPYKISNSSLTGTTFGTPIQASYSETIRNTMGPAGNVTEWELFNCNTNTGTVVVCPFEEIPIANINGTSFLSVISGTTFLPIGSFITIILDTLVGPNNLIGDDTTAFVYRITGITGNVLALDRVMPNLTTITGNATVICNQCIPTYDAPEHGEEENESEDQQDPWTLNNIWSQNPAGLDPNSDLIDEKLSGYTSNRYTSTKEYFGYNSSSGQTTNTGTTITNSSGDVIIVSPEEQHSLSLLHYSKAGDITVDPDMMFKYEDYIAHTDTFDIQFFQIYIPFIYYDRNLDETTIGALFFMDTVDYYINSSAVDTRNNQMKFRYLLDQSNIRVGKVFVNHKVVVFDDQEIVAALDYKSNRRFTLPIPRLGLVPIDSKCNIDYTPTTPLLTGTTGETVFISYVLSYTGDTGLNGIPCNYYSKIVGSSTSGDVSVKFNINDFQYLRPAFTGLTEGYIANKLEILVQKVATGDQPDPILWRAIDVTDQIPNHTVGQLIDPVNLRGTRFIVTDFEYDNASLFVLADPDLIDQPGSPEFGDEQPFAGSIKLVRATDLEVMKYFVNLPSGDFETTQNPSWTSGKLKRITEVVLLDSNKDVMVIAKASSPVVRTGTQVLAVKIDL